MHNDPLDWDLIIADLSERGIISDVIMGDDPEDDMIMFDWVKLKEYDEQVYEIFWEAHTNHVNEALADLVEEGLLNERLDENGDILYSLPEDIQKGIEYGTITFE